MADRDPLGVNCISVFEHAVSDGGWRLRPSSISVYRSMWRKYEAVAALSGVNPLRPTASEIEQVVYAAYPESENTAHKLFRVVLKTYEHSAEAGRVGYLAAKSIEHRFFEKTPVARTAFELPAAPPEVPTSAWKKLRSSALQALIRVSAPRMGELRGLVYRSVVATPDKVSVSLGRGSSKRTVVVDAASAEGVAISNYIACHPCPVATSAFFCGDEDGTPLNAATLYRQVKAFTESGGGAPEHHGTGAFRATLAKRMHKEGRPIEEIQAALGHRLATSTEELLRHVLEQPGASRVEKT